MEEILNESQLKAVKQTEGPLLIIAGPGSGKTKTLVERTIYLLTEKNVSPSEIMLSTFTKKAANELFLRISNRLKEKNVNINLNDMYIGTMHSIFNRCIEENIEYSDFLPNITNLDDVDQKFFLFTKLKLFKGLPGYNKFFTLIPCRTSWDKAKKILDWLDNLNESGINLEDREIIGEEIIFLREAQKLYKELLISHNSIDFSNIQAEFLRILLKNPEVLEKFNEKIKYIMIDEYQDTNTIQERIIFLLGQKYKNLCVVGDDDQAIYRFRGGNVKNILEFSARFSGDCKIVNLDINYRSDIDIIRFCREWIRRLNWGEYRHEKDIRFPENKPVLPTKSVIRVGGKNSRDWQENIYKFIKTLKTTGKINDYNDVAFLSHGLQTIQVKELKKYLESKGIEVYSPRSRMLFEKEEIKLLIGALLVYYPQNKYLVFGETNATQKVFYYYKECMNTLRKYVGMDEELKKYLIEERRKNATRESFLSFKDVFYELLQFSTFKKYFEFENKTDLEIYDTHNLSILVNIFTKYDSLTNIEEITNENLNKYLRYFFMTYLKYLSESKKDEYEDKERFPKNSLPFLTFHQSKGLEFPVVMVDSLYSTPFLKDRTYEDDLKEKFKIVDPREIPDLRVSYDFWRLYYTAFSRAQDLLVLTAPEEKKSLSGIFAPFFYACPEWNDSKNFEIKYLDIKFRPKIEPKKFLSYSSNITLYEYCPRKYNLIHNFKFPQEKSKGIEYGIFFHKVLERINDYMIEKKVAPTSKILDEIIKETKEPDKVYEFDMENIKKSAEKYLRFTKAEDVIASEYKIYNIEDEYILEGVIDLVKRDGDDIAIVDFKTGAYNQMKGELYKKQLAIYSYLLKKEYKDKNIKSFVYFDYMDYPYVEVKIDEDIIKENMEKFNNTTTHLLSEEFEPRKIGESCEKCEFRYLCKAEEEEKEEIE